MHQQILILKSKNRYYDKRTYHIRQASAGCKLFNRTSREIYQLVETLQTQKPDNQHQLIDIDKASILIQKSKPTIYRLARTGLIPAYKRGKKLYFYEDELLKWIEAGKNKANLYPIRNNLFKYLRG